MNGRVLFLGLIMLALAGCSHLGGGKLGGAAETGQASYYADKFEQRKTANGERYRHDALTAALMKGRITEGPAAGSWDPVSHLGTRGGRVYTTAAATLCLEVYYRYLPFYKLK